MGIDLPPRSFIFYAKRRFNHYVRINPIKRSKISGCATILIPFQMIELCDALIQYVRIWVYFLLHPFLTGVCHFREILRHFKQFFSVLVWDLFTLPTTQKNTITIWEGGYNFGTRHHKLSLVIILKIITLRHSESYWGHHSLVLF